MYMESSAKLGLNVKDIFKRIAAEIPELEPAPQIEESIVLTPENN